MKFLTLTALLAVVKAGDDDCTSGEPDCECDDTDANNCLSVGAPCDDTHSACGDDNVIAASADEPETCDDCDAANC